MTDYEKLAELAKIENKTSTITLCRIWTHSLSNMHTEILQENTEKRKSNNQITV